MKERLVTLALAVAALALFYALVAPKVAAPQERVTRPTSIETGPNGHAALFRWLQAEGIPVASFRERYTKLPELFDPSMGTGHLLISAAPHDYPIRASEQAPLRDWIAAGNTLLVLAGLSDTPEWSMGEGRDAAFMENLEAMSGLRFAAVSEPPEPSEEQGEGDSEQDSRTARRASLAAALASMRLEEPAEFKLVPNGAHPLLEGVSSAVAVSEFPSSKWRAYAPNSDLLLELAHEPRSQVPVLWWLREGRGQILVAAYGSLFTNKVLGREDNARLAANIVSAMRTAQGTVIFDDAHQGLVAFYDPDAFFGDSRLHRSLLWLLGLWLVFVLGALRLRPAADTWKPLDITSFVRATGGFMARVLKPAAAGQQLFVNFFNDVRRRLGLTPNGAPVWEWLRLHTPLSAHEIARLQQLHLKVASGRRVDLVQLHNELVRVREILD